MIPWQLANGRFKVSEKKGGAVGAVGFVGFADVLDAEAAERCAHVAVIGDQAILQARAGMEDNGSLRIKKGRERIAARAQCPGVSRSHRLDVQVVEVASQDSFSTGRYR